MKLPVLLTLIALVLAGCTGVPDDAAGHLDRVTATVTVTDLAGGEPLVEDRSVTFRLGTGGSGFGFVFERGLTGLQEGASKTITVRDDPSLAYGGQVTRETEFEQPLTGEVTEQQFLGIFDDAVPGQVYEAEFSFYDLRVESVDNGTVTYRWLPEDGQRDDVPSLGATLVTHVDEARGVMIQHLEPVVGATFVVPPPNQFQQGTPLDLDPGSYQVIGGEEGTLVFAYHPTLYPEIFDQDFRIEVTVTRIVQATGTQAEPVDGNFGVRQSPVINGDPDGEPHYGALGAALGHEAPGDDHMDDGHTH